ERATNDIPVWRRRGEPPLNSDSVGGHGDMRLFGVTRGRVCKDHALICPDSFGSSPRPGWEKTQGMTLIAPAMGARFTQYLALMEPGATAGPALPGVERVVYVLDGEVTLHFGREAECTLAAGGYAFVPTQGDAQLRAKT